MPCACLGPQNGEPLCPCQMRAAREYLGRPTYAPNAPGQCTPVAPKPHGCICPPGSEATCQGLACPRRNHLAGIKWT